MSANSFDSSIAPTDAYLASETLVSVHTCEELTSRSAAPASESAWELFERQARHTPDGVALRWQDRTITYAQLHERANELAVQFFNAGAGPEKVIATALPACPDLIASLLASLRVGAAFLALEPAHPVERLRYQIADSGCILLVTNATLRETLDARGVATLLVEETRSSEKADALPAYTPSNPQSAAYVMYTSGSTGRPKGTVVTHGNFANYLAWCHIAYLPGGKEEALVHSSFAFDLTLTSVFLPLTSGGSLYLLAESSPEALAHALKSRRFGLVKLTPSHLRLMCQMLEPGRLAAAARLLVVGGEALFPKDLAAVEEARGMRHTIIVNEYGPTEATVGCCTFSVPLDCMAAYPAIPIGKHIPNTTLHVLDSDLRPVACGAVGELYIGGACLARGYLRRPDLTAERFIPDPFAPNPGERLYRSGDLVRALANGELEYIGRIDSQLKVRGFRVEIGEIEARLSEHPELREVAVLAQEDTPGDVHLVAYFTSASPPGPDPVALRRFLQQHVPDYMIPSGWVSLTAMPLTASGKIDRSSLREHSQAYTDGSTPGGVPMTGIEEILTGVWTQVLRCPHIGLDDNYFVIGGDSIRSIQIMARAQERGLAFELDDLFGNPTIRALARLLEQRLIVNATGPSTVRLEPPLVVSEAEIDEALVRLGALA